MSYGVEVSGILSGSEAMSPLPAAGDASATGGAALTPPLYLSPSRASLKQAAQLEERIAAAAGAGTSDAGGSAAPPPAPPAARRSAGPSSPAKRGAAQTRRGHAAGYGADSPTHPFAHPSTYLIAFECRAAFLL